MVKLLARLIVMYLFLMVSLPGLFALAQQNERIISFGTLLNPNTVIDESKKLAQSLTNPSSSQWRAKGDQRRTYNFPEANANEPYRVCVPENWDGKSKLPLVMFLHGNGSNESTYLDQNNKQMVKLANEHGFLLVSPIGDKGAYGNFLRLSAPFGNQKGAADLMAQVTAESEKTNELSEKDVINVLELILHEYPIDSSAMFLTGHSMGSGGTWYIGGKYRNYWRALAPMSGPFVQENGYPWDSLHQMIFFVTEGIQTPSIDGSRTVSTWMNSHGFNLKYKEVNADHGGMVSLVLPDVFDFFDESRKITGTDHFRLTSGNYNKLSVHYSSKGILKLKVPYQNNNSGLIVTIKDLSGKQMYTRLTAVTNSEAQLSGISLPAGAYILSSRSGSQNLFSLFVATN